MHMHIYVCLLSIIKQFEGRPFITVLHERVIPSENIWYFFKNINIIVKCGWN